MTERAEADAASIAPAAALHRPQAEDFGLRTLVRKAWATLGL